VRRLTSDQTVLYEIKWVGYPKDQNTMEPAKNLLPDARDILAAYHKRIGGDPTPSLKRSASQKDQTPVKRTKQEEDTFGSWVPKTQDWEPSVNKVTHIEKDESSGRLVAFVDWKNGKKTKIDMDQIYQHCPRPMLKFYEQHL
jgi:chromobox protein 1